jgi:SAM-dependent methyltransferase
MQPWPMSSAPSLRTTERFSDRVENYVRFRPSYPPEAIDALCRQAGLKSDSRVADVGSGTGIFAALLLPHAARVFGVEPNAAMRAVGERSFGGDARFVSVAGTAEATGLPGESVDLVTAAQAFHWFDASACRREFARILRPGGRVALIWNERLVDATPFLAAYEALLRRHATDYALVNHANLDASAVGAFYEPRDFTLIEFPNEQRFNFEGLKGRLLSSSYAPNAGHPAHGPMLRELEEIFGRHAEGGMVAFRYTTKLYLGSLA